jgi:hypothetical protein
MAKIATKLANASSPDELRRTFEAAIAKIQHSDQSEHSQRRVSKQPVSQRAIVLRGTMMPGDQAAEKRALTDAARALAQLWNISPTLVR